MLLLAHLLSQARDWRGRRIRLLSTTSPDADPEKTRAALQEMIERSRVKAEPVILQTADSGDALRQASASAALVFAGFEPPEEGEESAFCGEIECLIEGLPNVLLVSSAGGVSIAA